jgi:mannose-6-phosphate isomerase-like protein (cupin superfamily)
MAKISAEAGAKSESERQHTQEIREGEVLLALIVRSTFDRPGITFFTPGDLSQQLAIMQHPAGKLISPHVHNPVLREVSFTQEVLIIRKGRLRVDFYMPDQSYLYSTVLDAGDVILLVEGGHGFEALDALEMIEVKQGPYAGDKDKTLFSGIPPEKIHLIETPT